MNLAPVVLLVLLGSAVSNGDDKLSVIISTNPPLSGPICAHDGITFACHIQSASKLPYHYQYQWSTDGGQPKIGNTTYSMVVPSQLVIVTCKVFARYEGNTLYGSKNITVQPIGAAPKIVFQYVTDNFVYKLTGRPFNLTANVDSNLNLTSLYWSPPEHADPVASRTITVRLGNITTTTLMLLENATLDDGGRYTLTAVNECGQKSSQVEVEVLSECPYPTVTKVQPGPSFTAVEGYNATMKCSFDGHDSPASPLQMCAQFPGNHTPVCLNEQLNPDCNCWVEHRMACSAHTDPNDCCRFELIMHSTPPLKDNGTIFFCTILSKKGSALMSVLPSPKILEPPQNLDATVGSKAVFTCDFEASTDSKISQIHWEFNGTDLAGCRRFQDLINCTVTQSSTDTNYISSTLEINPVQADNAGQYTCYCSYDTSTLDVSGAPTIRSDRKSATLSVRSSGKDHSQGKIFNILVIIGIVCGAIIIILLLGSLIYCIRARNNKCNDYTSLEQPQSLENEITDEVLDRYVMEELFPFWEKFGKALQLPSHFLENAYSDFPSDPAERLRVILREWRATTNHPSVSTLDRTLEQLGLVNLMPQYR